MPFLHFNAATGHFDVDDDKADLSWGDVEALGRAALRLKQLPEGPFFLPPTRLDEIVIGYPDRCLEHHVHQVLDLGVPDTRTCWMERGFFARCLGRWEPARPFDDADRRRLLVELGEQRDGVATTIRRACQGNPALMKRLVVDDRGWILFHASARDLPPASGSGSRLRRLARRLLRPRTEARIPGHRDVRQLVRSIDEDGWDNERQRRDGAGILGYSRRTGLHHVVSGRHRIAALEYLRSHGRIAGTTLVEYPVITYPWDSWMLRRPHPALDLCSLCRPDSNG